MDHDAAEGAAATYRNRHTNKHVPDIPFGINEQD
jgi:hypothetical protein